MRTTLNLDDDLMTRAKIRAAQRKTTLTAVIEGALRETLGDRRLAVPLPPPVDGGGLPMQIDLDKSWHVIEQLEGSNARP